MTFSPAQAFGPVETAYRSGYHAALINQMRLMETCATRFASSRQLSPDVLEVLYHFLQEMYAQTYRHGEQDFDDVSDGGGI